ncbi:family 10 glycosylhydrolase [soil metagenome]
MAQKTGTWYRDTVRWGQTNLTEIDPIRYDREWWKQHWRNTRIQGVIVNAGGIVAYYPSALELHHRAEHLGDRDLYGEITEDARAEGLAVVARMDSNRADYRAYLEHPEWFTRDANGDPYRAGELFITCINSAYYEDHLTAVLKEVIERYRPDGFADNSWSGLQRDRICYCPNCKHKFQSLTGAALPAKHDWESPTYRQWIRWNYDRRLEIWDLNNRITQQYGGAQCLWIGMNAGELIGQANHFRDYKAICERTELLFLDSQFRRSDHGFQRNGESGALIHGLLGWDKLIPESMAMYAAGAPSFRLGSKPEPDARFWAVEGFAGGIQPWWHHIGAYHDDRRQYRTAEPLFRWHEENESNLIDREPVATVGVIWSQENVDYYGKTIPEVRYGLPWRGMTDALIRARIPYLPIHADHIARDAERFGLTALVLPNVGLLTDSQSQAIREFVNGGGGLLATGESSLYDETGTRRDDFALADLFGANAVGAHHGAETDDRSSWDEWGQHTYLRISPERRGGVYGPLTGSEPAITGERHTAITGFEETDSIPFGGRLEVVRASAQAQIPLTLIPPFPIYPPETSWMRQDRSHVPALVLNEVSGGRVAYLPADLDRTYGRSRIPDHARLLANLTRWVANDRIPLAILGAGFIHATVYRQGDRFILHLVNLTGHEASGTPVHEFVPIGPFEIAVQVGNSLSALKTRALVSGELLNMSLSDGWASVTVRSIADHEVLVFE